MTSRDPIGRWAPYEAENRRAAIAGVLVGIAAVALVLGAGYLLAKYGLEVAP